MSDSARQRVARIAALPLVETQLQSRGLLGFAGFVKELHAHRELLVLLVRRELKARYKDSSLGFVWSLIKPVTMLLIYFVAIGQFLGAARGIPEFGVFVFSGLTLWGLYSEIVISGSTSIVGNAGLIKKVYLPREIFPLAAAGSAIFNFVIQFAVLLLAVVVTGQFALSLDLIYIPVAILVALIYGIGFALLLSALNVYLRDIQYLVDVGMVILFWASPIVYSWSLVVGATERLNLWWLEQAYLLNPMTIAIMAFQRGTWRAGSETTAGSDGTLIAPQPWPVDMNLRLIIVVIVGLIFLFVAQRLFSRLQGNFAQEI